MTLTKTIFWMIKVQKTKTFIFLLHLNILIFTPMVKICPRQLQMEQMNQTVNCRYYKLVHVSITKPFFQSHCVVPNTYISQSYCDIFTLSKSSFESLSQWYPDFVERVKNHVKVEYESDPKYQNSVRFKPQLKIQVTLNK